MAEFQPDTEITATDEYTYPNGNPNRDEERMLDGIRTFDTGATRNADGGKLDYEAFLSPAVITKYAEYMHRHRIQADGTLRSGDNWQLGIPRSEYMKSAFRHFMAWWTAHREGKVDEEAICGVLFNAMGYLHAANKEDKQ